MSESYANGFDHAAVGGSGPRPRDPDQPWGDPEGFGRPPGTYGFAVGGDEKGPLYTERDVAQIVDAAFERWRAMDGGGLGGGLRRAWRRRRGSFRSIGKAIWLTGSQYAFWGAVVTVLSFWLFKAMFRLIGV